jgi:hypothetical protein
VFCTQRCSDYSSRHTPGSWMAMLIGRVIQEINQEIIHDTRATLREIDAANKKWAADRVLLRKQETSRHPYDMAFFQKIFQPSRCIDCGEFFETLYPPEHVALGYKGQGVKRCPTHRRMRRQATHGGDRRRCKKFGVPYDSDVNRILVLERDNWTCHVCGLAAPKELRSTYDPMAPEIDHVHALGEIIDGKKSPGHVWSNVRCIHRKCNTDKNRGILAAKQGDHDGLYEDFLEKRTNGWIEKGGDVETLITCPRCGLSAVKLRVNAKYCSEKCSGLANKKRRRAAKKALRPPKPTPLPPPPKSPLAAIACLGCSVVFVPSRPNRKYHSRLCKHAAMHRRQRSVW